MELIDFSIGEKIGVGKNVSTIAMLGPLLAMPSGQGLNMTLLAILKVNGAKNKPYPISIFCVFLEYHGVSYTHHPRYQQKW